MKTSIFTFVFACFSFVVAQSATNPWDINKLSEGQIVELSDVHFDVDETIFSSDSKVSLDRLVGFLKDNKSVVIEVQGHTNSIPPQKYCDELSEKRAQAVREYLISAGVDASRLVAVGYGKRNPIASNNTAEGRNSNQRVDVKILSL